jgi:putative ATP-dependent endonuclease of the OLD family
VTSFGLTRVHVRNFRSIREAEFRPERVSALVGEASAGKSNLLAAIRALLDPKGAPLEPSDVSGDGDEHVRIAGELADGSSLILEGPPPGRITAAGTGPPALYLPAALRSGRVIAPSVDRRPQARRAEEILAQTIPGLVVDDDAPQPSTTAETARGLVEGLESTHGAGLSGLVFLIEEPELFLPPQTQRYLYRLLRQLAGLENQILYSTHSPAFLNVARLEELVFTTRPADGTRLLQPEPLEADDEFRASSEFDATRSELFLARAAVLVEGLTEKLALPFVFTAMGYDPDRERISIVECGGKPNVLLIARISRAVGVPFLAVHDRDAQAEEEPSQSEAELNRLIAEVAGPDGRVELAPDFEGVAGLRGHRHKPARAWRSFATLTPGEVPEPLARVVERAVALARR